VYKKLAVFEQLYFDTKTLADQKALPPEIYKKLKHQSDLPLYEWNILDANIINPQKLYSNYF